MNQIRIFDDLKASPTVLPSRAILAAMAQPEAVTPDLLALLDEVLANPAAFLEEQDHYGHLYALLLLAQFRVPEALPRLFADEDELEGEDLADAPPPLSAETRRTILAAQGPPSGQPGRNAPCPCGSGKKFKRGCGKG